ncbi:MAG: diacylglycerol kinase family lipid kinase [Ilumatobacter sp.]|nr:diacylglycerol kinase family lipid kinase [Ilumatobacter sp.]
MSRPRTVAIWNPASGNAPDEQKLRDALGEHTELVPTTEDDPGPGQATEAVDQQAEIVVACGGDGTVRACLDPLAGTNTSLAVVPLGTGNLLAANIGVPSGFDAAAGIGLGPRRTIDLGRINGEAFAVMAGTGFDAMMIRDASSSLKSKIGSLAYVVSGARHLRSSLVPTTVTIDDEPFFDGRTSMVLVGNFGTITGGIDVFPDALPDDGLLDVAVVSASTWREWAAVARRLLRNEPLPLDLARRARGRKVVIDHARPRAYELDGEDRDPATHLEIEVQPGALTVHQHDSRRGEAPTKARPTDRGVRT